MDRTMIQVKFRCPDASTAASAPTAAKRARSETIIIFRREIRSASAPPISSVVSSAVAWQKSTIPNRPDPTSVYVFQPRAVRNAASPMRETVWPAKSSRKSR